MITNAPLHADKKVQLKKLGTKKTRIFLILHVNKKINVESAVQRTSLNQVLLRHI